ncbi:hypothetical protein D6817_01695 [Candidatus Pacearchaeota archaeon]|nr:MAG: hypothetical protein D6817_01695 [Candidatus Pacearchaeota archaeon]
MNKKAGLVLSALLLLLVFLAGVYFGVKWTKSGKVNRVQQARDDMRSRLAAFVSFVQEGKGEGEMVSKARELCEELGGRWGIWQGESENDGRAKYSCNLPTTDGGKPCTDSSECESFCSAGVDAELGARTAGKCYPYLYAKCARIVENGVFAKEVCVKEGKFNKALKVGESDGN